MSGFLAFVVAAAEVEVDLDEDADVLLELEVIEAFESLELELIDDVDMFDNRLLLLVPLVGKLLLERLAKVDLTGIRGP